MVIQTMLGVVLVALTCMFVALSIRAASNKAGSKKGGSFLIGALVSLLLFVTVPFSVFSISTGETGVVKVFGEAKELLSPGIHFRLWLTSTVERYDLKTREIKLDFQAYSKDAQTVTGLLSVQFQLNPDEIMAINREYGSIDVLEKKLEAITIERAKSVFADKGAMMIVETRSSLSGDIEQRIAPVLPQYHVSLTTVALSDIEFNAAFESAVEQKMIAEQEKLRAEYDKERAIIKAEEQLAVAEREAQAVIQRAHGDAEALTVMQDAWSSLAPEVKDAMLRQMFYEKWNGILPEVMAGDNLDLILGGYGK